MILAMTSAAILILGILAVRYLKNRPVAHFTLPDFTVTPPPTNPPPTTTPDPAPVYVPPVTGGNNEAQNKNLLGQSNLPRGMRNNNPGNLRISNSAWQGKIPVSQNTDKAFEQFVLYKWGVRAMIKLILNYIAQGNNTITKIINKYAPSSENNTTAYINSVAQKSGVNPNTKLTKNDYELLKRIIIAMAQHENGPANAVTEADFNVAWQLL